jgi:hypothetical protein
VNNGLISADVAGGTITHHWIGVVNNNRLKRATEQPGARTGQRRHQGATGTVLADNGVVLQNGRAHHWRHATQSPTAAPARDQQPQLPGQHHRHRRTLDMATLANSRQRVNNGLVAQRHRQHQQATASSASRARSTLGGSGSIVLGSTGAGNRIDLDGNGTTTFAAGVTVRGHSGTIGGQLNIGGTQTLVNNGTINAERWRVAVIGFSRLGAGQRRAGARAGRHDEHRRTAVRHRHACRSTATGTMNLANGAKTQGQLAMGGTGAALNLGTGNLTITSDYTNAGAGTGNSFNRRAGVTAPARSWPAATPRRRSPAAASPVATPPTPR